MQRATDQMGQDAHNHDGDSHDISLIEDGTVLRFVLYGFLGIILLVTLRFIYKIIRDYYKSKLLSKVPSVDAEATTPTSQTSTTKPAKAVGLAFMPLYFKV